MNSAALKQGDAVIVRLRAHPYTFDVAGTVVKCGRRGHVYVEYRNEAGRLVVRPVQPAAILLTGCYEEAV